MASNRGGKSPITLHFKAVGSDYDLSQTDEQNDGSRSDDVPKTLDKEKALSESPGSDLASSASLIVFVDDLQADETDSQEAPQDDETSAGDPLGDDAEHVDQFDDLHARLLDLETSIEGLQEHIMQMKSESIEANRKNEMLAAFTRAHHCALAPVMELEFLRSIQQLMNDATVKRDWGLENPDECLEAYIEQSAAARTELGGYLTRSTAPDAGEQDLETVSWVVIGKLTFLT